MNFEKFYFWRIKFHHYQLIRLRIRAFKDTTLHRADVYTLVRPTLRPILRATTAAGVDAVNLYLSGEGGIDALTGDGPVLDNSMDMLNLCSGQFGSSAPDSGGFGGTAPHSGSSGGRVTVQDISFNLAPSPDLLG